MIGVRLVWENGVDAVGHWADGGESTFCNWGVVEVAAEDAYRDVWLYQLIDGELVLDGWGRRVRVEPAKGKADRSSLFAPLVFFPSTC
jgi:hypothetical protein